MDGSELGERVIPHARAVAAAFGGRVTLLQVLEKGKPGQPPDALEWEIRRREAHDYVDRLAARKAGTADGPLEAQVVEGAAAEEICRFAQHEEVDLTVLCSHGESGQSQWSLASTARKLVEMAPGSFLLVPASAKPGPQVARYERVLVPLDGSKRAESVLPAAMRIAQAQRAELILAHVIPVPELTEIGPAATEDLELRDRLVQRNQRVATEYLDRLRAQLAASGLSPRVLVLSGGEPRGQLARLIEDERVDLVVLSAHGRSGRCEAACGSVAASLIANATRPLLVVRQGPARTRRRVRTEQPTDVRLPSQATL